MPLRNSSLVFLSFWFVFHLPVRQKKMLILWSLLENDPKFCFQIKRTKKMKERILKVQTYYLTQYILNVLTKQCFICSLVDCGAFWRCKCFLRNRIIFRQVPKYNFVSIDFLQKFDFIWLFVFPLIL